MPEQMCTGGDLDLCFETFGDPGDPTVLLVMGLATQMHGWHEDFCEQIAAHGFHVVRFDNRDIGRSGRATGAPPTIGQLLRRSRSAGRYTLADMAADAVGLLDHLEIERAHIVGASMGGMIAQTIAARHPQRVLSLVSLMSTTGGRFVGQPSPRLYPVLLRRAPGNDREAFAQHVAATLGIIGSPGFPRDDEEVRERARLSFDRGVDAAGPGRQLGAIIASGDRTRELRTIKAPTLVIHGDRDRLVPISGGRATARAIPGARMMVIEGMGHDLPRETWPQIVDGIVETAARATAEPDASASSSASASASVEAA